MEAIVDIQLSRFFKRLASRAVSAEITAGAKQVLIREGWDPQYGARPLKRAIQRLVENELAKRILAGDISAGERVVIDATDGALKFEKKILN